MQINTLMLDLVSSELADLAVADTSQVTNTDKILSYINRAIRELNKEFNLLEKEGVINLVDGQVTYQLNDNDLIKVNSVFDPSGNEMELNVEGSDFSVFTSGLGTVQYQGNEVENAEDKRIDYISVIYLVDFDPITSTGANLPINVGLVTALSSYVGYLAHSAVRVGEGSAALAHKINYDREIAKLHKQGFNVKSVRQLNKFSERGFV